MASTNKTANLELSQFVGTDKPDWLTDYNGDMGKIDGAYGAVNAVAEEAAANAESAATSAAQAAEDAAEALAGIAGAVEAAAAATQAAEQATSVSTSALTVANGAAATAQSAAADAQQALQVANNAKVTAENAQAAAAQAVTDAQAAATDAASAQSAATIAANDAAASAAIAATVDSRVTAIEECVPSGASSNNKFATASDVAGVSYHPRMPVSTQWADFCSDYISSGNWRQALNAFDTARNAYIANHGDLNITQNSMVYISTGIQLLALRFCGYDEDETTAMFSCIEAAYNPQVSGLYASRFLLLVPTTTGGSSVMYQNETTSMYRNVNSENAKFYGKDGENSHVSYIGMKGV